MFSISNETKCVVLLYIVSFKGYGFQAVLNFLHQIKDFKAHIMGPTVVWSHMMPHCAVCHKYTQKLSGTIFAICHSLREVTILSPTLLFLYRTWKLVLMNWKMSSTMFWKNVSLAHLLCPSYMLQERSLNVAVMLGGALSTPPCTLINSFMCSIRSR